MRAPRAFLFDLDGVLVRTEELHFAAYRAAVAETGATLGWGFERYCIAAHYGSDRLRSELAGAVPGLLPDDASWSRLYSRKSSIYRDMLGREPIELQPGAAAALERLAAAGAPRAVVTNSTREQAATVRRRQPALGDEGLLWVVREDYRDPKPAGDGYALALERLGIRPRDAVGFEDTPRGVQALAAAGVRAVLVTAIAYPELGAAPELVVHSLAELPDGLLPPALAGGRS